MTIRNPARKLALTAAAIMVATGGLLGWALFWPESSCASPACARQRFAVAIELDSFRNVKPIQFDVPAEDGRRISLRSMFAAGGIDVTLEQDQADLPYVASSGALDRADLYQFAVAWRNRAAPQGTDARIYALLATALVSDTGEPLFGIMFDDADREGFAVAPATTAHKFGGRELQSVPKLQLRTFAHELLHALNRRHLDAMQMDDGRLTLEAPTRCISGQQQGEWFLREAPLMQISPATIRFFQSAARSEILPGKENAAYQLRRASPTECEDARANLAGNLERSRWELASRRLRQLFSIQSAGAAESEEVEDSGEIEETQSGLLIDLRLQALPAAYPLGYPIAVRLIAHNAGAQPLPIKGRLMPAYGMVRIEYRADGDSDWNALKPLAWFEPASDEDAMLVPGETTEQTVPIYFGDDGWTFKEAGDYEIRARLHTGADGEDVVSEPVQLSVDAADAPDDLAALQPLLDENQHLRNDVGRLLTFGGRIGSDKDIAPLEAVAQDYGHTALGAALRLTLISQMLRAPIDPRTGERPPPDLSDASELLRDTCTDSGIAALKYQLLIRHAGAIPDNLSNRAETAIAAWDGTTSLRGGTMPTYSDPALQSWGPSIHFCYDDANLHGASRASTQRIARQLRRAKPARIVVVGHGDYQGMCRYNDALALRRAQTIRRMLIDAGIRGKTIQVASLGERRPADFASTTQAHDLNRRVEILVEDAKPVIGRPMPERILPKCEARPREPVVTDETLISMSAHHRGFFSESFNAPPAPRSAAARRSRDSLIASSTPL